MTNERERKKKSKDGVTDIKNFSEKIITYLGLRQEESNECFSTAFCYYIDYFLSLGGELASNVCAIIYFRTVLKTNIWNVKRSWKRMKWFVWVLDQVGKSYGNVGNTLFENLNFRYIPYCYTQLDENKRSDTQRTALGRRQQQTHKIRWAPTQRHWPLSSPVCWGCEFFSTLVAVPPAQQSQRALSQKVCTQLCGWGTKEDERKNENSDAFQSLYIYNLVIPWLAMAAV